VSRSHLLGIAAGAAAGVLLSSLGSLHAASAAQLAVTAAPIQTWTISHGLPDLPTEPTADVADSIPETSVAPDVHGGDPDNPAPAAGDPRPADEQGHAGDQGGQAPSEDQGSSDPGSGSEQPPGDGVGSDPADDGAAGVSEVTQDVTGP
jgi:hypothetical protein